MWCNLYKWSSHVSTSGGVGGSVARNAPHLSLPGKLVFPSSHSTGHFSMLGLGDIVMPGLLLCFVMRYDAYKKAQQAKLAEAGIPLPSNWMRISYFHCSLFGYFLGLLTATISSEVSHSVTQSTFTSSDNYIISRSSKQPNQHCCIWYHLHSYHYLQWLTWKVI